MTVTVYHNPRCSKSRATLELLHERGIEPHIVDYLNDAPSAETLLELARMLEQPIQSLLRAADSKQDLSILDDTGLAKHLSQHPRLIQRPIVVTGRAARIGRPPERILEILP